MAKNTDSGLGVSFGVQVPEQSRASRYDELYDLLNSNPGEWADVTDAFRILAERAGAKVPSAQSSAITLRKQGFVAQTRKVDGVERIYAMCPITEEADAE